MRRLSRCKTWTTETNSLLHLTITETIQISTLILLVVTLPFESVGCVAKACILIHLCIKIILDISRRSFTIKPCLDGLPDHDGQILTLLNLSIPHYNVNYIYTRRTDNNTTADFQLQLSYEQWDDVFGNNNVN